MMCDTKKVKKLGFFDENFFLYWEDKDLIIIGAGISGWTVAHYLIEKGYNITIYENCANQPWIICFTLPVFTLYGSKY